MSVLAAPPPRFRRAPSATARRVLGLSVLLGAGALACGGAAGSGDGPECGTDESCAPTACAGAACPPPPSAERVSAGEQACSVVSCPPGTELCCMAVSASATGNGRQSYVPRVQLVDSARSRFGEVRAEFEFDAPNQQGWVTFELGAELDLARLAFIGRHDGVADRFLAVNTNRPDDAGGCAFSFDLEPRPSPFGAVLGNDVPFNNGAFCYGNGRPGRASELAFAIFSTSPGPATLVISNLALIGD